MIKFSIIIPNYNKGQYIKDCLDSVINQTLNKSKYEVIVIDDGSSDNSPDIIRNYDVKFLQTNRLMAGGARNKGLDVAKGEYILFLDSDDYLSSTDVLEKLDQKINNEDIIYLNFMKIDLNGGKTILENEETSMSEKIANTKYLACPTKCFKKRILDDLRFVEKCSYEDVNFTITAMCIAKTETYFKEPFYTYRKVENSITTKEVLSKQMIDLILQISSLYYLCEKYSEYKESLLLRIKNDRLVLRIQILDKLLTEGKNEFREHFPLGDN